MNLLLRWRLRRAAKHYALRLGAALNKGYGASEAYTPGQIRTSAARLGLNPQFLALGYAAFLDEAEYAALAAAMPLRIPYNEARELVARFRLAGRFGASEHYESGFGMSGGLDTSSHGGAP